MKIDNWNWCLGGYLNSYHFHNKRHPKDMGVSEIEAFLSYLAVEENVAGSTQNQATIALHGLIEPLKPSPPVPYKF